MYVCCFCGFKQSEKIKQILFSIQDSYILQNIDWHFNLRSKRETKRCLNACVLSCSSFNIYIHIHTNTHIYTVHSLTSK